MCVRVYVYMSILYILCLFDVVCIKLPFQKNKNIYVDLWPFAKQQVQPSQPQVGCKGQGWQIPQDVEGEIQQLQ